MTIRRELIDELLKDYPNPQDLIAEIERYLETELDTHLSYPKPDVEPSPQTTLIILLGASAWPFSPSLQSSPAFANSAKKVKDYFCDPKGRFGLPPENWLDLFDTKQASPSEVYQAIITFLEERLSQMDQAGIPARDLLFYYIGHGVVARGSEAAYHLAIRNTQVETLRSSAI